MTANFPWPHTNLLNEECMNWDSGNVTGTGVLCLLDAGAELGGLPS